MLVIAIYHSRFLKYFPIPWLQAVLNMQVPVEHAKEVNDCKHLIKTLVMGTLSLFCLHIVLIR